MHHSFLCVGALFIYFFTPAWVHHCTVGCFAFVITPRLLIDSQLVTSTIIMRLRKLNPMPSPQREAFAAKPQARLMFVDRCYHLPFLSQAELAEAEGDEGLSVYLISLWGLRDDAWVGARAG